MTSDISIHINRHFVALVKVLGDSTKHHKSGDFKVPLLRVEAYGTSLKKVQCGFEQ